MEREPNVDKSMQKKNYTIIQITKYKLGLTNKSIRI